MNAEAPVSITYFNIFGSLLAIIGLLAAASLLYSISQQTENSIEPVQVVQVVMIILGSLAWWSLVAVIVAIAKKLFTAQS